MPAKYNPNAPTDKLGQPIYEDDPRYQDAINARNEFLKTLDTKLSSNPQQPLQNVPTSTIQPTPLGAYTAPSINSTEDVAKNILIPKEEPIPQYQQDSPFDYLSKNIFTPTAKALSAGAKGIGSFASDVGQGIKQTASDVGNWADRNRVGLGGFGTAIGAGLARRDPSEALANYNKSIIQNKQQRQEEEKFKMATDGNHPYNQQFRELFARMLPDVTAKLGERFNSMTVQNFKDAGMGDLPVLIEKQMEISKNDPSSAISQRTRDMVFSQYGIQIPKNVSANEIPRFIEAYNTKLKQGVELKKLDLKKGELEVKGGKAFADIENQEMLTKLKQEENARQAQLFEPQLEEQKVKAKVATETQQYQIDTMKDKQKQLDLSNKSNDPNTKEAILARKNLEKRFPLLKKLIPPNMTLAQEADVVKGIEDFRLKAKGLTDRRAMASELRNAQLNIASMNDRTKRLGLQQTQEYRNQMIDLKKQQNERENLKLAYQNPTGTIPQKQLDAAGISKKDLSDTVEYSSDVQNAKDLVNEFKDILNRNGRFKILSDAEIRGKLQTMRARFNGIIKRKDVLGALDAGVLTYVDQLLADPTAFSNALKPNSQMISQANTFLNGLENEEKNYYLGRKFDPRVARDIGQFQILVRKAGQGDKEAYKKLRDTGYSQDQINDFYQKRFNVIGDEEE